MKRALHFLPLLVFLFPSLAGAADRYWVGGSGNWDENKHWSAVSGGKGGAGVPGANDNVYFDAFSFKAGGRQVNVSGDASCLSMSWKKVLYSPVFTGPASAKLFIYGGLELSPAMNYSFSGEIHFLSNTQNNAIISAGKKLLGNIYFDNPEGYWILNDDLTTGNEVTVHLLGGTLHTGGHHLKIGSFNANSGNNRGIIAGNSKITIQHKWNVKNSEGFFLTQDEGFTINFATKQRDQFQSGNIAYKNINLLDVTCPPLVLTTDSTPDSCNVAPCTGTATVSISGGTPPYTIVWNPSGQTTTTATGLCPGSYIVDVTDSLGNNCADIVQVTQPAAILINHSFVRPLCFGQCNGSITANPIGGVTPYTYLWTPSNQTTQTATGLCAGTYTVVVTDTYGCTQQKIIILTQPPAIVPNGSSVNPLCFGDCTGSVTVNPTGGTPPFTYLWAPSGATTNSITGLCAPTCHTVTITDANGCDTTFSACITQPPLLTANITTTNNPVACNGVCNATATVNPNGGVAPYTYLWTPGNATSQTITGLCAGTYTVVVTDANGCTRQVTTTITQPTLLTATQSQVNLQCNNVCIGTATVTPAGGTPAYSWSWTTTPVQTTQTATGLCAGNYTCTVTDANGCTLQVTFTITQPPALTTLTSQTNPLCFGQCNGTATVTAGGGTPNYTYTWSTSPVQTTSTATGLCGGNYTVTVTDANGCTIQATFTITTPPQLTASGTTQNVACNGQCNGSATINPSGGTPGYTYSWVPGTQTTQTATGLCAGSYTVTVTDANGCTVSQTFLITQPPLLTVTLNATALDCNGDCDAIITTVVAGGVAPYTYTWAPGNETTSSLNNQCAGSYTVTVTDANGCTATANITINQPTQLTLTTATSPASCFGVCDGSASVIAGGGTAPYTYSWAPTGQTTSSITNQCAGTYTIIVTDANGCTATQQVTITGPTQLLLGLNITNVTCNGACNGTATTNVSGGTPGYSYSWMPGNLTTSSISNLCPGSYTVTVTDASGCTAQQIFLIQQPPPLNVVISNTTTACNICNGTATATPNGGTPGYTYSWAPTNQTTQTATGLCPGSYTCYISDANGCTATAVATITLTVVIQITTSGNTLLCFGDSSGTACAAPSGGQAPYSYLWFTSPFQTTQCATGLSAGTYTVIATDANGCTGIDSVTFTNPPQLISSAVTTNTSCNQVCDGTATGSAVGGTGSYTYSWALSGQTTQTATGLCAGTYTLFVTDANGCTDTTAVTITQSPALAANPTVTDANCNQCDGSITVNPSGGIAPYTFLWQPGNFTTPTINNLCVGVYTLTITDAAGCSDTFNIVVNNINGPTVSLSVTDATCNGGCDGAITSNVNGGTPPYTYSWAPVNQTTTGISGLCAGGYTLFVTDQPGCVTITTAIVNEPSPITWTPLVVNSTCANNCNGSVDLTPTGGTPPYTFSWSTGDLTEDVSGLCAGTYTVIIFDANLCSDTTTFTITQPPLLTVTTTFTNVNCNGDCDGTATANPAGGTGPYLFSWQPGNIITPTIVGLCPGSYTVTITDANGCTTTDTVTITEPTVLTATTTQTNATCFGVCDGTALVTASGGTPAYTYSWTTTPAQSTPNSTGLCAGQYNVHVIDANGCENIQTVIITEPSQIVPNVTVNNATCNALCNGTATATPTGGSGPYFYSWLPGGQTTQTATGLCAGSYTVTVTDANGCTGQQIVIINQPAPVVANPSVLTQPTCGNVCDGVLTANPFGGTGPYTYSWMTGGSTAQTVGGICAGTYTLTVTDANGCTDQQTINLPAPNPLTVVYSVAPANCGVCDGALTANPSGGTSPYTYAWSTGDTTQTISALCAGMYTLVVTDAMGCTQQFTVGLSNSSGGILTMGATSASCFGVCDGSVSVSATGSAPFLYTWSPNNCSTTTCAPLCAGSYTVEVSDSAGCITIDSIQVTQPTQILDNAVVVNAQCNGICNGSITLNPSGSGGGPYTYTWLTPPNTTSSSINNLCTGTYIVEVTAANGCRDTFSYTVNGTTVINITSTGTNINCSNSCTGTATVTNITGGASPYTYLWNDPSGQFTPTATGLCAGTYIVNITDANGCMNSDTVTVTQTPGITASFNVTNPACGQCNGSITATPSGGTSPYTLLWNTGATTTTITGVCAGVYSVVITDANGCSVTLTVPVSNSTSLTSGLTVTNETCFGACDGSASVSPSGGTAPYVINWTPSNQNTSTINNLCAGTYYVQVTDAAGCIITDSVVIGGPTQIVTNQAVVNTDCGSCAGSISLSPSGGTSPYTYLWSTGATTSSIISLCAGTYTVTITDATGCTQQYVIPITNTNGPSVTVSTTNIACSGSCTGTATANPTGGQTPYTYSWSTGAVTPSINALCSGNYWVMVTDANGCTAVANFNIIQTNPISFSAPIAVDPLCNGDANGTITVVPNGGTLPYTYTWSAPGGTTPTLGGLTGGSYTVYVTDANGCSDSLVITLTDPPVLSATNGGVTSSSCNTVADGAITLNVTGGTPGYTFTWSNGATTQNVGNLLSGGYTVTVTDANGCTDTVQFVVPAAISVIANITGTDTICLGDCADLYATTSVNATTYSWYDMPGGNLQSTNDTLTVCPPLIGPNFFILIASNGACSDTDTIAIVVNALPVADAGADVSILTSTSTTIGGNPTGPSGSTFSWSPANGLDNTTASNPTASPSITTTYYVTVTSPEGCTDIDTVVVTVVPEIVFPNGISPNGDGANDYWIIDNIQLFPDNVVEIYNRWGELLFRGIGYDNSTVKWDGTYKGEQLPVGTYYYIIELETDLLPEENKRFTGPITLMR